MEAGTHPVPSIVDIMLESEPISIRTRIISLGP